MGRKRTHHDAKRTKVVSARITHETYDLITQHAEKLGLTRAGYVEHLIEDRPVKIIRPVTDELPITFLNELKRVGNNLNQIAHARNSGHHVDPRHFRTVVTEIVATICSNEVLRRRYEEAEAEVAKKGARDTSEDEPLRETASREPPKQNAPAPPRPGPHHEPAPAQPQPIPTAALPPQRPPYNQPQQQTPQRPRGLDDLMLTDDDIAHRLWPPNDAAPEEKRPYRRAPHGRGGRNNDSKNSFSWFKLPWRV